MHNLANFSKEFGLVSQAVGCRRSNIGLTVFYVVCTYFF